MKIDPSFALKKDISRQINLSLNKLGFSKNNRSCWEYLPYTLEELNQHLEWLFSHPDNLLPNGEVWMTWVNRGVYRSEMWNDNDPSTWRWQIDHIIPHSRFAYTSMEDDEFRKCWALENLRPYSAKQNNKDGNRRK